MAIDTAAKRFSMMSMDSPEALIPPDGTIGQGDRQTFLLGYAGILWATAAVAPKEIVRFTLGITRSVSKTLGITRSVSKTVGITRVVDLSLTGDE